MTGMQLHLQGLSDIAAAELSSEVHCYLWAEHLLGPAWPG